MILLDSQYWSSHNAFGNSNVKYLPSPKKDTPQLLFNTYTMMPVPGITWVNSVDDTTPY